MSRRVLITGGTGFVGSHAVEHYLAAGWTVRTLVRDPQRLMWLKSLPVEIAVGTMTDQASLAKAAAECHLVVHCAGLTKTTNPRAFYRINGQAVEDFARAAAEQGVGRFVLCSTQAAAGPSRNSRALTEADMPQPISDYGRSKLEGEERLKAAAGRMEWIVLRPPSIMGPRDEQFIPLFKAVVRYGVYPQFGAGGQRYSFIGVTDFARALLLAGEATSGLNDVFFVASDETLDWSSAARTIAGFAGKRVRALKLGVPALKVLATLAEAGAKLQGQPALLSSDKIGEILAPGWVCSPDKILRTWGFRCELSCAATLRVTYDYYRHTGRL
jgi:nucleoside-diphosphate-sugar epimerase